MLQSTPLTIVLKGFVQGPLAAPAVLSGWSECEVDLEGCSSLTDTLRWQGKGHKVKAGVSLNINKFTDSCCHWIYFLCHVDISQSKNSKYMICFPSYAYPHTWLTHTVINCLWPITLFQIYHKLGGLEILEICPGLWVFSFRGGAECQAAGTNSQFQFNGQRSQNKEMVLA